MVSSTLLFLISFIYFYRYRNGLFFLQEKASLFIFSGDYLYGFLMKPGGLLEYAGNFLTQGYFSKVYGSLAVSLSLLLFFAFYIRINKLQSVDHAYSLHLALIASCLLILVQVRENHFMCHTLGYLLTALYFLAVLKPGGGRYNFLIPVLFPLFFYLAGSFALLFALVYIVYCLTFKNGIQKYLSPGILILTAIVTFIVFKEIIFLQPADRLLRYPLNIIDINDLNISDIFLSVYMVLFSLLVMITGKIKIKKRISLFIPQAGVIIIFSVLLFFLALQYDPDCANDLKIEEFFYEQNWDAVIGQHEKVPSKSATGQYLYNLALTEKDQLCERMFFGKQDHGVNSIVPPMITEYKRRLSYFYFAVGLINEAHHLAYESMVTEGCRSENLKMLIKTDLINGYYKIAERNINILKKTLHYRKWADKYQKMLFKPDAVFTDPELAGKIKLLPGKDFFITPFYEENIDLILMANPDNKKVFEYKMACLLLEKDYKAVMYQVKKMKDMKYTRIPRHIEEAMMIFINHGDELPYLGDFEISYETRNNFSNFLKDMQRLKTDNLQEKERFMKIRWGNTFWYYFEFK